MILTILQSAALSFRRLPPSQILRRPTRTAAARHKRCFMKLSRFIFFCLPCTSICRARSSDWWRISILRPKLLLDYVCAHSNISAHKSTASTRGAFISWAEEDFPGVVSLIVARKDLLHVFYDRLPLLTVMRWFHQSDSYSFTLSCPMIQISQ